MPVGGWGLVSPPLPLLKGGSKAPLSLGGEGPGVRGEKEANMSQQKRLRIHPQVRQRARELRQNQTPAEQILWRRLRGSQLAGYKFRRQHPIGRFIVDFYCAAARLVVEVDGDVHAEDEQAAYDVARTDCLEAEGYRVLRVTNDDVYRRLDGVMEVILQACDEEVERK